MDLKEKIESWNKGRYRTLAVGEDPKIVILGEKHSNDDSYQAVIDSQVDLIDRLKPKYVLHEQAGVHNYNPQTERWSIPKKVKLASHWRETQKLSDTDFPFLRKYKGKPHFFVVGCDLSISEIEGNEYDSEREKRMGERILEYSKLTKSPLIAIVGSGHINLKSGIFPALNKHNLDYLIVNQSVSGA